MEEYVQTKYKKFNLRMAQTSPKQTEEVSEKDVRIQEKERLYIELKNIIAKQSGPEVAEKAIGLIFSEFFAIFDDKDPENLMIETVVKEDRVQKEREDEYTLREFCQLAKLKID